MTAAVSSTVPVKIRENDRGGSFAVSGGSVPETDGETSTTVTVSRTGGSGGPVQVTGSNAKLDAQYVEQKPPLFGELDSYAITEWNEMAR